MNAAFGFFERSRSIRGKMEIYQLQSFLAVSETGNLTRAAQKINISQSALSSHIKALEEELGVELFVRQPRGMQLSKMGKELLSEAKAILQASRKMKQKAMDLHARISGTLNIGINTDPKFLEVSDISKKIAGLMPGVSLSFTESQTFETCNMLKDERIDVGFHYGRIPDPSVFSLPLFPVTVCITLPKRLEKDMEKADIETLASLPWVWTRHGCPFHLEFQSRLKGKILKLNQVTDAAEENIVKELVRSGAGIGLMRKDQALDLVREGAAMIWKGFELKVPLGIACLEKRKTEKMISGFLDVIQNKYKIS
jgi:DNA-binding transcriptional LysR family regulator